MKGFIQFSGTFFLTMILFAAFFFILKENFAVTEKAFEKTSEVKNNLASLSKMTLLSMKKAETQIAMPIKNVRTKQIADTWNAARAGGRSHSGQDIFAKKGTPVYSATEGYVLRVGENRLGGKVVFIYGAGGRRYYGGIITRISTITRPI